MRIYVDDQRHAPSGWLLVRTIAEAKELFQTGQVTEASLDHDMGACAACQAAGLDMGSMETDETTFMFWCTHAEDGTKLVDWMIEHDVVPPVVYVHSMNPCGSRRMIQALDRYWERKTAAL